MDYNKLYKKALKFVDTLQEDITSGKRKICENYGQKEIRRFEEKHLNKSNLTYSEKCNIKDILYKVSSIC